MAHECLPDLDDLLSEYVRRLEIRKVEVAAKQEEAKGTRSLENRSNARAEGDLTGISHSRAGGMSR